MCLLSCAAEKTARGRSRGSQVGCTHAHQHPVAACCSYRWQCGKLVPFLVSKPDGLVPPCRRPVRAIAAPHTATQVMWESRGLRPAVTYHILPLPFGSVWTGRAWGRMKRPASGIKPMPVVACRPDSPLQTMDWD